MATRKKIWLVFAGIIALTVIAGVVDYPKGPDLKIGSFFKELKVNLGLDLQGGTHLVYDADTSQVPEADKSSALGGVRDVIERRVNAFGVSEPLVQTNPSGDKWRVIIELPGINDVNQAIKMIGETPLLEFKEEKTTELTDEEKKEFYLFCDNPLCGQARMVAKEGDNLGIEAIRDRIEIDDKVMRSLLTLEGVPKIYLRNAIPVEKAKDFVDDYELTPAYSYERVNGEVKVIEKPWVVKDDDGVPSYSLLPQAVAVSLIKQMVSVLGL